MLLRVLHPPSTGSAGQVHAGRIAREDSLVRRPFSLGEVMEMTAVPRQRDPSSWAKTAVRRMIGTLRDVNDELVRAHEAMALPSRARRPGQPGGPAAGGAPAPAGEAGASPRQQTPGGATAEGSKPAA
jgi:hypothetical protein